ncbi:MAG: hypothetical protein J6Z32_07200 [Bacteroidales bacterium]|nr:hypothetical protein [Bacteroidales bacterium]
MKEMMKKVLSFVKENKWKLIILLVVAAFTWFVMEVISNWGAFMEGFRSGYQG